MNIFISWSGARGKAVAEALRSWLGDVHHKLEPWISSEDIDPGTRWNSVLAQQLENTRFGIVCVTPKSVNAPWLLFEAGALTKTLGISRLCLYLIQMDPRDLPQPLSQFDAVSANRSGTLKLLRSVNHALDSEGPLTDDRLQRCFERWWPDLESALEGIPAAPTETGSLPPGAEALGLEGVFSSRSQALTYFGSALRREIERSRRASKGLVYLYLHARIFGD